MSFNKPRCNCPDAINEAKKNMFSNYNSQTFDRNWRTKTTNAGTISEFNGIRKRGFYCKHELAVLRVRGEMETAFPNGIPYEPKIEQLPPIAIEYQQKFDSDNLGSDKTFLNPIYEVIDNV